MVAVQAQDVAKLFELIGWQQKKTSEEIASQTDDE